VHGGTNTDYATYPWFVRLRTSNTAGQQSCGGTFIAPRVILTAAHCTFMPKESLQSPVNRFDFEGHFNSLHEDAHG
jgi:secreted trypsin-like serine protease